MGFLGMVKVLKIVGEHKYIDYHFLRNFVLKNLEKATQMFCPKQ